VTGAGTEAAADAGAGASGGALPWRIGGVRITGVSQVMIADQLNPDSTAPRFAIEQFEVGELASTAPEADTAFEIVLRPDEYSEFVFEGVARPLSQLHLNAQGRLHGFAMKAFNGLVADDLGHRFLDGQLDNDFTIKIDRNQLEMSNDLLLASLDAEALPDKDGPPLTTAIALLTDRDGNIKLEVPVAGDLTDPDFRVMGALDPIIMKAVAGAAALAIQPLGSALLVGTLVADQALKVRFNPVPFAAGATALDAEAQKYLEQLAGKLKEKPKLGLKVCGVAVVAERKRDKRGDLVDSEDDLLALAQQRAEAAGAYLEQQGVGAKQVRACRPAYDAEADGVPRVEIRL
jgi:hypothetical protein